MPLMNRIEENCAKTMGEIFSSYRGNNASSVELLSGRFPGRIKTVFIYDLKLPNVLAEE
jgi:hypothetical protein